MNLPNTCIIGVQKAGSTSLTDWLGQHPDIYSNPRIKDLHYFVNEKWYAKGLDGLSDFHKDVEHEKIILHSAINYFYFPIAAERLHQFNPNLKLILVLRNPVHRASSAYRYFYKLGEEELSFEGALQREQEGKIEEAFSGKHSYLAHGLYAKQLKHFLKFFSLDQMHILFYEDLMEDKEKSISGIFKFLKVDRHYVPSFEAKNFTGAPKSRGINKVISTLSRSKALKGLNRLIPYNLKVSILEWIKEKNTSKQGSVKIEIPAHSIEMMENYFKNDIEELGKMLKMDLFKKWKIG